MEPLIRQIYKLLLKKKKTLAVAESCTGGLLSGALTQYPGSSGFFIAGLVAYNNRIKQGILRIPAGLIAGKGAVSEEVAQKMAQNMRKISKTDFAIAITGIAGPTGGTPEKPIGTVFIALDSKDKKTCQKFLFPGNRTAIRKKAAFKALGLLKTIIEAQSF